jgi:diaminopimelate decarboxylase
MELKDNKYVMEGLHVTDLCKKYGTPFYLYETAKMQAQYKRLTNAFSSVDVKVNYACKALSNLNVLKFFHALGAGLDAVSIQEVNWG